MIRKKDLELRAHATSLLLEKIKDSDNYSTSRLIWTLLTTIISAKKKSIRRMFFFKDQRAKKHATDQGNFIEN